jgi:hypothetical protein
VSEAVRKPPAVRRSGTAPIVPERSVAGRTLFLLIAIMTFLSGVTLGAVVLVQKSAIAWSSDVGREVTIQIRPAEGELMASTSPGSSSSSFPIPPKPISRRSSGTLPSSTAPRSIRTPPGASSST